MAVQNREQIGWLDCPMCATRATVHECAIGRGSRAQAKYWRCECGTVQPWKPQGQRFIADNFQPMKPQPATPETEAKPEAAPANDDYTPETAKPAPETAPKPKKRGLFALLMDED